MKHLLWGVITTLLVAACGGNPAYKRLNAGAMPGDGNFDGVYYSEVFGRMELTDNGGGNIVGLYEGERFHGKIEGVAEGDLLRFTWTQWNEDLNGKTRSTTGQGYFRYEIREEGTAQKSRPTHYIVGEWGYGQDNAGNPWECVKFPTGTKKILKAPGQREDVQAQNSNNPFDGGGSSSQDNGSAPTPAPADGGLDGGNGGLSSEDVNDLF